jgi:TetR/AcrR family transcriptional regulator, cholesterol catabolism regulator
MSGSTREIVATGAPLPRTPAQRDRYDRVLREAERILLASGEDALQMKDLANIADVAIATMYRYFPSKRHLVLAVLAHRYEEIAPRLRVDANLTARERIADYLIRSYQAQKRTPHFTMAVQRALFQAGPEFADLVHEVERRYADNLAIAGGDLTESQRKALPLVAAIASAAAGLGLTQSISDDEVRAQILIGTRLLELSPEDIRADEIAGRMRR